jgi:hypothetical protein
MYPLKKVRSDCADWCCPLPMWPKPDALAKILENIKLNDFEICWKVVIHYGRV